MANGGGSSGVNYSSLVGTVVTNGQYLTGGGSGGMGGSYIGRERAAPMRDVDAIRTDAAVTDAAEKWSERYHDAIVRLLHDVEPLLAALAEAEARADEAERNTDYERGVFGTAIRSMQGRAEAAESALARLREQVAALRTGVQINVEAGHRLSGKGITEALDAILSSPSTVTPPEPKDERDRVRPQLHPNAVKERATVALDGTAGPRTPVDEQPDTCEHGKTGPHEFMERFGAGGWSDAREADCPGPAATPAEPED